MATDQALGLEITELRLGLPGTFPPAPANQKKRAFSEISSSGDRRPVVGWPPVCSYRRKNSFNERDEPETRKMYVKVGMDGAPFLRKMDLKLYKGYSDLGVAMEKLFEFSGGFSGGCSEYVPIYEDRDGDWMLVGDVPWKMFIESCRKLRIMKRSEAKGFEIISTSLQMNHNFSK